MAKYLKFALCSQIVTIQNVQYCIAAAIVSKMVINNVSYIHLIVHNIVEYKPVIV